jgi:hypothetical protein
MRLPLKIYSQCAKSLLRLEWKPLTGRRDAHLANLSQPRALIWAWVFLNRKAPNPFKNRKCLVDPLWFESPPHPVTSIQESRAISQSSPACTTNTRTAESEVEMSSSRELSPFF